MWKNVICICNKHFVAMIGIFILILLSGCGLNSENALLLTPENLHSKPSMESNIISKKTQAEPQSALRRPEEHQDSGDSLQIAMATRLIGAGINPFLNKLPKMPDNTPNDQATGDKPGKAPPPLDPLDEIQLIGIIIQDKMPMALLGLPEETSDSGSTPSGKTKTIFAQSGDTFIVNNTKIQVGKITSKTIVLFETGKKEEQKTITLPDIVGFSKQKEKDSTAPDKPADPTLPANILNQLPFKPESKKSVLQELREIQNPTTNSSKLVEPPSSVPNAPNGLSEGRK